MDEHTSPDTIALFTLPIETMNSNWRVLYRQVDLEVSKIDIS